MKIMNFRIGLGIVLTLVLISISTQSLAQQLYVRDRLFLSVYPTASSDGERLTTIKNGAKLKFIEKGERYTKVSLENGTEGWVRSSYITSNKPAALRLAEKEKENTALRKEIDKLKNKPEVKVETKKVEEPALSAAEVFNYEQEKMALQRQIDDANNGKARNLFMAIAVGLFAFTMGFIAGYSLLAKRIKTKFSGMKVW